MLTVARTVSIPCAIRLSGHSGKPVCVGQMFDVVAHVFPVRYVSFIAVLAFIVHTGTAVSRLFYRQSYREILLIVGVEFTAECLVFGSGFKSDQRSDEQFYGSS